MINLKKITTLFPLILVTPPKFLYRLSLNLILKINLFLHLPLPLNNQIFDLALKVSIWLLHLLFGATPFPR